jgi:hypothetical protein
LLLLLPTLPLRPLPLVVLVLVGWPWGIFKLIICL